MLKLQPPHRYATPEDARVMAELVNIAGEGLPLYLWSKMAQDGQDPWEIGEARAKREEGSFSYRNTVLREAGGEVVAALIGYPLRQEPAPPNYEDMPALFVPLQQLEDELPGTWYLNVLATYPGHRGKGYGAELIGIAEQLAKDAERTAVSIIVSDVNTGARRLYERLGYEQRATRPMVKEEWKNQGENWVLLVRHLG